MIMDKNIFSKKTLNTQRPWRDRFVPQRESLPDMRRRFLWPTKKNDDVWNTKQLSQKKYIEYINKSFGVEELAGKCGKEDKQQRTVQSWPCKPRKKCYLSSADSVLDLPLYSFSTFPELIDWSSQDILVAALGDNYYKWSWRSQSTVSHGYALRKIFSCKFDPKGELLLLGTEYSSAEVHHNEKTEMLYGTICVCCKQFFHFCDITAVEWSPTGNSFVIGCSLGIICSFSRDATIIENHNITSNAICIMRVSPDARYLATAAVLADTVLVHSWPKLQTYFRVICAGIVKTLSWHPWRSALLSIGSDSPFPNSQSSIILWDAPTRKIYQSSSRLGNSYTNLDVMLFSHRTGEMVASFFNSEITAVAPHPSSMLLVLSEPDTVVDIWGKKGYTYIDRIKTMVFSPDGSKLATATAGDDLIIWNFLPEDKQKQKKSRRFSALPVYLDEAGYGTSIR